jgi:hypothetical protein
MMKSSNECIEDCGSSKSVKMNGLDGVKYMKNNR